MSEICQWLGMMHRRIFHYARWESVKELMYFCGDLDMEYLYNIHRWKFMIDLLYNFAGTTRV